ncbi:nitroreductase [bacterium]|jgi:nitroreductase|nr:nitroreductase [bacterium]MBT3581421.1 nitroreductase [bacterium]MBT4552539.1 nitroreductase [bacterium]MBT7088789.1 nitroreductase [bacterium]
MSFLDLVKKRCSVRAYLDKAVSKEKIEQILTTAHLAPSAKNLQPWHFIVLQKPENKSKIYECYGRDWLKQAPVILVVCANHQISWKRPMDNKDHSDVDVAIVIDHLTLAAAEQGLGSCWICMFDAQKCAQLFDLPEYMEPIALIPLGYPAKAMDERHLQRKELAEMVSWEQY